MIIKFRANAQGITPPDFEFFTTTESVGTATSWTEWAGLIPQSTDPVTYRFALDASGYTYDTRVISTGYEQRTRVLFSGTRVIGIQNNYYTQHPDYRYTTLIKCGPVIGETETPRYTSEQVNSWTTLISYHSVNDWIDSPVSVGAQLDDNNNTVRAYAWKYNNPQAMTYAKYRSTTNSNTNWIEFFTKVQIQQDTQPYSISYNNQTLITGETENGVAVSYKGQTLYTVTEGTKTFKTDEKYMEDDITVSDGTLTKTLKCKGKLMDDDVVVTITS